jgi:hypothetical protein
MGINEEAPLLDNPTQPGAAAMLPLQVQLNDRVNLQSRRRAVKVWVKSGKAGTTFDVIGLL